MSKIQLSQAGIDFIKKQEFFLDHAYQDSAGIWTIGYGSTQWQDGRKVSKFDLISEPDAVNLLLWAVNSKIKAISPYVKQNLTQNQQDAIISLAYNIGSAGFVTSRVLKLINANPNDPAIHSAWIAWNEITYHGKKKVLLGLTNRRESEYKIYIS